MDDKALTYVAVGAAIVGLALFVAAKEATVAAPASEPVLAWNSPFSGVPYCYFESSHMVPGQQQVYTPHRYPAVSGTNISTLVHYGLDAMRHAAPSDDDWRTRPPAEVMF